MVVINLMQGPNLDWPELNWKLSFQDCQLSFGQIIKFLRHTVLHLNHSAQSTLIGKINIFAKAVICIRKEYF